jgi:hypothetical protein
VVSFTPRSLYPQGKSSRYPFNRRLGGPQSRSGRREESPYRDSNSDPSVVQPVASPYRDCAISIFRVEHEAKQKPAEGGGKLSPILYPEDGCDMFLRNVWLSPKYVSCNPEDRTLHGHHRENLKHNIIDYVTYDDLVNKMARGI